MRQLFPWIGLLCLALLFSGIPRNAAAGEPLSFEGTIDLSRGQRFLTEKGCLGCHSFLGRAGAVGPDLAEVERGRSLPDVFASLWNHVPQMAQAFGDTRRISPFTDDEVKDLLNLFLTLDYLGNPGDAGHGLEILSEAGCRGCHRPGDAGSSGGATDLAMVKVPGSAVGVVAALWVKHSAGQIKKMVSAQGKSGWMGADVDDVAAAMRVLGSNRARLVEPGNPTRGERLFEAWACASCHSAHQLLVSEGGAPRSASENAVALLNHALEGRQAKAPPSNVGKTLADLSDLLAYLTWKDQSLEGGDAARGAGLFFDRGCAQCHKSAEQGGIAKPPSSLATFANEYAVASAMISHAGRMAQAAQMRSATWPRLTPAEVLDVIAYLAARGSQP